jgi:DNA-directed RNA polymerase specialized sigma24 family protein
MSDPLPEQAIELKPVLLRVGGHLGLSTKEAEDAVLETFLRVFLRSDRISEGSEPEIVFFRTLGWIAYEYLRRRSQAGFAPILGAGVNAPPETELPRATELAAHLAGRESTDPRGSAQDNALSILETRRLAARAEAERQRTAALSAEERLGELRDMPRG